MMNHWPGFCQRFSWVRTPLLRETAFPTQMAAFCIHWGWSRKQPVRSSILICAVVVCHIALRDKQRVGRRWATPASFEKCCCAACDHANTPPWAPATQSRWVVCMITVAALFEGRQWRSCGSPSTNTSHIAVAFCFQIWIGIPWLPAVIKSEP